jgi:glycosyltransferase involved in cell wall biosynthesis
VIVCRDIGATSSVADVARRQAKEISRDNSVAIISDSAREVPDCRLSLSVISPLRFTYLRRLAHVPNELAFAFSAVRAIRSLMLQDHVDVVVCHAHSVAAVLTSTVFGVPSVPVVLVTHANIFDRPKGTYGEPLESFYRLITPIAFKRCRLVLAVSPRMAELALEQGAAADKVHVLPNGVDTAELGLAGPPAPPRPSKDFRLGFVGRLSIEKGVDLLLRAVSKARQRGVSISLDVVGEGRDRVALESLAAELCIEDVVRFLGPLPRRELASFYASVNAVCVPSRSEPFGLVAIEAMACGTPVVVSDAGGLPWIAGGSQLGVVFPVGNIEALSSILEALAGDEERCLRISRAGLARAADFEWPDIGRKMVGLLDGLV